MPGTHCLRFKSTHCQVYVPTLRGARLLCTVQNGRRVLLLERDLSQPDRIVGELLQPGGYLMLKRLGLAHVLDNIDAQKVRLQAKCCWSCMHMSGL